MNEKRISLALAPYEYSATGHNKLKAEHYYRLYLTNR